MNVIGRMLGLDVGSVRIGVAVSDELGLTAQGEGYILARNREEALDEIVASVKRHEARRVIVGLPLTMKGTDSEQTLRVREFIEDLRPRLEELEIGLVEWDERLTTVSAERYLLEANVRRKKRKELRDQIAASLLLQGYLDWLRNAS